jgi:hypothetical protein
MSNAVVALSIVTGFTAGGGGTLTEAHSSMIVATALNDTLRLPAMRRASRSCEVRCRQAWSLGDLHGRRLAKDVMKSSGRGRVMSIPSRLQRYDSREPSTPR